MNIDEWMAQRAKDNKPITRADILREMQRLSAEQYQNVDRLRASGRDEMAQIMQSQAAWYSRLTRDAASEAAEAKA